MSETTVDLSEFYKYSQPKRPPCKVGAVLDLLRGEPKKQLIAALEIDGSIITGAAICTWIESRKSEIPVTPTAISNHRRKVCSCARDAA
jgi:hypothetical protein